MAVIPAKRRKIPAFSHGSRQSLFWSARHRNQPPYRWPHCRHQPNLQQHCAWIPVTWGLLVMVIKTGDPMFEVLNHYRTGIEASEVLNRLELSEGQFFVVSAPWRKHRLWQNFLKLVNVLNTVAEQPRLSVIVSTHPRTQKRVDAMNISFHPLVRLLKPLRL